MLGKGEEGIVKDFGNFAVKRIELRNKEQQNSKILEYENLVNNKDDDFISFYDCWIGEDGAFYVSMQKLSNNELGKHKSWDDYYKNGLDKLNKQQKELLFHLLSHPEEIDNGFPSELNVIRDNDLFNFLFKMSRKGYKDYHLDNIAYVNGKYKLFDFMKK